MSYDLTYSYDGHELIFMADTLDEVNAEIRKLYDEGKGVTILRIEETHDGPRTWQIEYPPAPPAGTRVRTNNDTIVTVGEDGRIVSPGGTNFSWTGALETLGPLTEVVETEVEAAARRLREARTRDEFRVWQSGHAADIRTVLYHVLDGGQLPGVK